jgi:hypothetical protein
VLEYRPESPKTWPNYGQPRAGLARPFALVRGGVQPALKALRGKELGEGRSREPASSPLRTRGGADEAQASSIATNLEFCALLILNLVSSREGTLKPSFWRSSGMIAELFRHGAVLGHDRRWTPNLSLAPWQLAGQPRLDNHAGD